jgi:RNA polymerase sigma-70 factor (ECF subfamily)
MTGHTPMSDSPDSSLSAFTAYDEQHLVAALRRGDEAAFTDLIDHYHTSMVRIASLYVSEVSTAEDVVQETWVAILHGLDRFEGRSSLKTWMFTILTNHAKTRGQRESRYVSLFDVEAEAFESAVTPDRFRPSDDPKWPHHWQPDGKPTSWDGIPEDILLSQETMNLVLEAMQSLPPGQREVMRLRDVEGWSSSEVCNVLEISETNQRVLLHRARSKVRRALEVYFTS